MDIRERLLGAAAQVYAEAGYRGATTRRIAQQAGVSEITLFRQFGSKEALMLEALTAASRTAVLALPDVPTDPVRELAEWSRGRFETLFRIRSLLRKVMSEVEEHPEITNCAKSYPRHPVNSLEQYVRRLQERGWAAGDIDPRVAAAMLVGAIFTEAMVRDMIPEVYSYGIEEALDGYVRLFLRAIGCDAGAPAGAGAAAAAVRET